MTAELALAAGPSVSGPDEDLGEFVIRACQQARALLREALDHGDIDQIAELRSRAEAIRVYTTQKQLGKEAQIAAAEIVLRADRGLATVVRRGQETGEFRDTAHPGPGRGKPGAGGTRFPGARSSSDYLGTGHSRAEIYAMTDGVPDQEFEDVLAEAKAEGNLSRANVVRKIRKRRAPASGDDERVPEPADRSTVAAAQRIELIRRWAGEGSASRQIAGLLGIRDDIVRRIAREHQISIRADEAVGRTRRLDSNRIVRETANALEALAAGAGLINPAELDKAQIPGWASSITASLRELNRLARTLKGEMTDEH